MFVVLLALMKPLPSWVYPCAFYLQVCNFDYWRTCTLKALILQVLPYLAEHFPATFEQIQPVVRVPMQPLYICFLYECLQPYYISSALSFYFVYDFCLYNNMSPLVSYSIRYLPLSLAMIVLCAWFVLMRRFRRKVLTWHGLWWIVLLMYNHVLHTSMSILNCPRLPGKDDLHIPVSFG